MIERKFGRLTIVGDLGRGECECLCECGIRKTIMRKSVVSGHTKSCGCLRGDSARAAGKLRITHGKTLSTEYNSWVGMIGRCDNPNNHAYADYGGRGIFVCESWRYSFQKFLDDMGSKPTIRHSLERINNNGPYSPDNCRWATKSEQCLNQRKRPSLSRFRGVFLRKNRTKDDTWRAIIGVSGKLINLGSFKDEVDAATAYNFAAEEYYGEFARYNIP